MIGYMIEQELENELAHQVPVATLLTQVIVDARDPAFRNPTKFIGPVYDYEEARTRADHLGWQIARDGDHWRRVVPSPRPAEIPDLNIIRFLIERGAIAICAMILPGISGSFILLLLGLYPSVLAAVEQEA